MSSGQRETVGTTSRLDALFGKLEEINPPIQQTQARQTVSNDTQERSSKGGVPESILKLRQ
jgi:hypothetical protein